MSTEAREVQNRYLSPNQKALQRFKKNKVAVVGFWVIVIAVLIAIFGYVLAPDSTPFANEQVLEIATQPPGFAMQMLQVKRNEPVPASNFFSRLFNGKENAYKLYPINSYSIQGDSVIADAYTGIKGKTKRSAFHLSDMVYDVKPNSLQKTSTGFSFETINGKLIDASQNELSKQIEKTGSTTKKYWLGTDKFGRDNLSRLILGVRVSISVGLLAALISLVIGVFFGSLAGFYKAAPPEMSIWFFPALLAGIIFLVYMFGFSQIGIRVLALALFPFITYVLYQFFTKTLGSVFNKRFTFPVDDVVMWFINVFWSIPLLLLVFALVLALGRQFWQIYLAVGLVMWVEIARIVRGQFLSLREQEFVEAAESLGFKNTRIILKHILPNCIGPIIVITAANFASAIIIEAGLSFLGIGVQPPRPSWGIMLNEYYQYIGSNKSFLALIPGFAIMLLVLAFNLMGNGLRDAFDVKGRFC